MGLFDAFSSSSGKKAANKAYQAQVSGLQQGLGQAQHYTGLARGDVESARDQGLGQIDTGLGTARTGYGQAQDLYTPLASGAMQGFNAYGDVAGLGGQEGYDRAFANFRADPGYQYQLQQGEQAILRNANARGMLASGNTSLDLMRHGQGMADQSYGNYVNRLSPYLNLAPQITGQQAGLFERLAGLEYGAGADKAGITTRAGSELGGMYDRLGERSLDVHRDIGRAGAQREMDRFAAEQAASQNMWGALLGLAGAGVGAAGQAGGFGKLFS